MGAAEACMASRTQKNAPLKDKNFIRQISGNRSARPP
jgi:hypothetical protein